jgi:hypothetical protein
MFLLKAFDYSFGLFGDEFNRKHFVCIIFVIALFHAKIAICYQFGNKDVKKEA